MFIKWAENDVLVAQIYVDDIVFGYTSTKQAETFSNLMGKEFEMSTVGELTFFLGLQVKQQKDVIFISQSKYAKDLVKKFGLESAKEVNKRLSWIGSRPKII